MMYTQGTNLGFRIKNMVKKSKKDDRTTSSLTINKEDIKRFNEARAVESGRRKAVIPQQEFIKFLTCLYNKVLRHDATILDEARKEAESR